MDLVEHDAHQQPTQEAEARGSKVQGQTLPTKEDHLNKEKI